MFESDYEHKITVFLNDSLYSCIMVLLSVCRLCTHGLMSRRKSYWLYEHAASHGSVH